MQALLKDTINMTQSMPHCMIIIFMLLASEFLVAINTACATILSVGTMGMCTESVTDSYKKKLVYQDHEMAT